MATTIQFHYKDKDYTLEFTRKTVTELEKRGFRASEIMDAPMTNLPTLFAGAFLAHHRFTKPEIIEEILGHIADKKELIGKLAEMYNEPLMTLLDDDEEDEGKVEWTVG